MVGWPKNGVESSSLSLVHSGLEVEEMEALCKDALVLMEVSEAMAEWDKFVKNKKRKMH